MNRELLSEELDLQIEQLMNGSPQAVYEPNPLLEIAAELCLLPSEDFKHRLKADLFEPAEAIETKERKSINGSREFQPATLDAMASLTPKEFSIMPADPRSFLLSFTSHAAVVVLIASGIWVGGHHTIVQPRTLSSELSYVPMPVGDNPPRGGGSGGDRSTIPASRGTPPKFSEEQLTPPAIIVRNPSPKLPVDATVLGPPQLKLPQSNQIGDILSSNAVIPSNGAGARGGFGDNSGTGAGNGLGAGAGAGRNGGCCTGVFRPGLGVSAPRAIYDPDPEYSDEARKAKYQGRVVLSIIVDPSGRPKNIYVARSLGMGLDEKAIEAVQKWKFSPGMKDGYPVAVQVNVEVNFRLY